MTQKCLRCGWEASPECKNQHPEMLVEDNMKEAKEFVDVK